MTNTKELNEIAYSELEEGQTVEVVFYGDYFGTQREFTIVGQLDRSRFLLNNAPTHIFNTSNSMGLFESAYRLSEDGENYHSKIKSVRKADPEVEWSITVRRIKS